MPSAGGRWVRRGLLAGGIALLAGGVAGVLPSPAGADAPHKGVSRISLGSGVAQTVSIRCGGCHSPEFALWVRHAHSRYLIDPARDPRQVAARWGEGVPGWKEYVAGRFGPDDVALAYGVLATQIYFRRSPGPGPEGAAHRLLPAQWNHGAERWEPLGPLAEPAAGEGVTWEAACAGCHTTGFDPSDGTFVEVGTGCEACHGPGEAHLESGGQKPILRPSELDPRRHSEICGACHARGRDRATGRPYPVGFVPGAELEASYEVFRPVPGEASELFWPDGTERRPFMEYQGFVQSGHYRVGLTCTTCHLPHGSDNPRGLRRRTRELCVGCHGEVLGSVRTHDAHPAGRADCVDCHMTPAADPPGAFPVRTHTFRFLDPTRAQEQGMPTSCAGQCHAGRDAGWAARAMEEWR